LSWAGFKDVYRNRDDLDALGLPVFLGPTAGIFSVTATFFPLLFDFSNVDAHLLHEVAHHLLESTTATFAASASTATTMTTETEWHLLLANWLSMLFTGIFWQDGDHNIRHAGWVSDLEEGMLVSETFFTVCAVVKVLADSTLVTDSHDGIYSAAITLDLVVHNGLRA